MAITSDQPIEFSGSKRFPTMDGPGNRALSNLKMPIGRVGRSFNIYPGLAGYDLQAELDYLGNRSIEPNIYFNGRFLAPAMPRLQDKPLQIAIVRDENVDRSRIRLLMPYSIEKPGFGLGTSIIRSWSNNFGPQGTPLLDEEDAGETLENFFEALANPVTELPGILVLPDLRLKGRFAQMAKVIAMGRNLPVAVTAEFKRPMLQSPLDGPGYLSKTISPHHVRDMRRQERHLERMGKFEYMVSRQPVELMQDIEEFLLLEARGWKGKKRTAMLNDRMQAAFAREVVFNLAEIDAVRIHSLRLNDQLIASMVVFIIGGEAYTWKTCYDETLAKYSPGKLLLTKLTEWHLDDLNIRRTDSCALPDHPLMSRFWAEREDMGTLVIGLHQNRDRDVRQVSSQLHIYKNTRSLARALRDKILAMAGR